MVVKLRGVPFAWRPREALGGGPIPHLAKPRLPHLDVAIAQGPNGPLEIVVAVDYLILLSRVALE